MQPAPGMRQRTEAIIAFARQWTPEQLAETCRKCGEKRGQHILGIACMNQKQDRFEAATDICPDCDSPDFSEQFDGPLGRNVRTCSRCQTQRSAPGSRPE